MGCSNDKLDQKNENDESKESSSPQNLLTLNDKNQKNKESSSSLNNKNQSNLETQENEISSHKKLKMKKSNYNGVTILENIQEYFPDDVSENAINDLVLDALNENISEKNKKKKSGKTISKEQANAIASIVYERVQKGKKDKKEEDEIYTQIDMEQYPILKGVKVKIGLSELNKDAVKNMLYEGKEEDEKELENTLKNLKSTNGKCQALMIELWDE